MAAPEILVKMLDKVPSLRVVMDHLPNVRFLIGQRRTVPDVPQGARHAPAGVHQAVRSGPQVGGQGVDPNVNAYRDWLDELWSIFGEDRVMFGSDWPQSERLEFNSYPNVSASHGRTRGARDHRPWRRCSGRIP